MLAVYGSVVKIEESLRFTVPVHKSAVGVCCTRLYCLNLTVASACVTALTVIVKVVFLFLLALLFDLITVEFQWLFAVCGAVFVDCFVQVIYIFLSLNLGLLFHKLILVGIGFQVCTVRIQNLSSYKSLCHCLTDDLVEYLLRNVGALVSAESVLPYYAYVGKLFGQIVTDEPPVCYVHLHLFE